MVFFDVVIIRNKKALKWKVNKKSKKWFYLKMILMHFAHIVEWSQYWRYIIKYHTSKSTKCSDIWRWRWWFFHKPAYQKISKKHVIDNLLVWTINHINSMLANEHWFVTKNIILQNHSYTLNYPVGLPNQQWMMNCKWSYTCCKAFIFFWGRTRC